MRLMVFIVAVALMLPGIVCAQPDVGPMIDTEYNSYNDGGSKDLATTAATIDTLWTNHSDSIQLDSRLPGGERTCSNIASDIANRAQSLAMRGINWNDSDQGVNYIATCGGQPVLSGKGTIGRYLIGW